jgi:hypothetical protein
MFDIIYRGFFILMIVEIILFVFLNLPFPKTWKAGIFDKLATSSSVRMAFNVQLILCLMVLFFYVDLHRSEALFLKDKRKLRDKNSIGAGTYI